MKSVLLLCFALCLFDITRAVDNGQYRPGNYVNDGRYRSNYYDGRYSDYLDRYQNNYHDRNRYYPGYADYQPFNYQLRPYQQLATPYSSFGKTSGVADNVVSTAKSAPVNTAPVNIAPIVVSTAAPVVVESPAKLPALTKVISSKYPGHESYARIVAQDSETQANGYHYKFETENGISAGETGVVASSARAGTSVTGFYEYVGDDGKLYRVDYTADENGFRPSGAHLV